MLPPVASTAQTVPFFRGRAAAPTIFRPGHVPKTAYPAAAVGGVEGAIGDPLAANRAWRFTIG